MPRKRRFRLTIFLLALAALAIAAIGWSIKNSLPELRSQLGASASSVPAFLRVSSISENECSDAVNAIAQEIAQQKDGSAAWSKLQLGKQSAFVLQCSRSLPEDSCKTTRIRLAFDPAATKDFQAKGCTPGFDWSVIPAEQTHTPRCNLDRKLSELITQYAYTNPSAKGQALETFRAALDGFIGNWCFDCPELAIAAAKTYPFKLVNVSADRTNQVDGGAAYVKARLFQWLLKRKCMQAAVTGTAEPVSSSSSTSSSAASGKSASSRSSSSSSVAAPVASSSPSVSAASSVAVPCVPFCTLRDDGLRTCKSVCKIFGALPADQASSLCPPGKTKIVSLSCTFSPTFSCDVACVK